MFGNKAVDNGKIFIVINAIDLKKLWAFGEMIKEGKDKLGLRKKYLVGHVGSFTYTKLTYAKLTYAKNHIFLIKVFEEIMLIKENAVLFVMGLQLYGNDSQIEEFRLLFQWQLRMKHL